MSRNRSTWQPLPNRIGPMNKQICPEHETDVKNVMVLPGRVLFYDCPEGHRLGSKEVAFREVVPKKK